VHHAQSMSDDGNYSDAIMDVECARAELEGARQELLCCHKNGARQIRLPLWVRIIPMALCAVLALPLPIENSTREMGINALTGTAVSALSESQTSRYPEPASPKEKQLLEIAGKAVEHQKTASIQTRQTDLPRGQEKAYSAAQANKRGGDGSVLSVSSRRGLPADEIFRLMEVGRKALQEKDSTVVLEFY
ncbi:MAG: hypothetical protein SOZ52_04800, partial [Pyramidobacter sp.]|nr:hypothetical protein [Pyramidobacter sp.]